MVRIARIVRAGIEGFATHRGDQRRAVFFVDRGRKPIPREDEENQIGLFQ